MDFVNSNILLCSKGIVGILTFSAIVKTVSKKQKTCYLFVVEIESKTPVTLGSLNQSIEDFLKNLPTYMRGLSNAGDTLTISVGQAVCTDPADTKKHKCLQGIKITAIPRGE